VCVCVCVALVDVNYRRFAHHRAIDAVMHVVRDANAFIQSHEPWTLAKSRDPDQLRVLECTLHVGLETARVAALALSPVVPALSRRILDRLGCDWTESTREHMTGGLTGARRLGADCGALMNRVTQHHTAV